MALGDLFFHAGRYVLRKDLGLVFVRPFDHDSRFVFGAAVANEHTAVRAELSPDALNQRVRLRQTSQRRFADDLHVDQGLR